MKTLITGIAGQDGSYLSELLLSKGFEVHGLIRRNSTPEHQETRINHLGSNVELHYGDVTDMPSLCSVIKMIRPDWLFNLAAQSHVRISFDLPAFTHDVNARGAFNVFEACRIVSPTTKIYQASSSEMFGTAIDGDGFQRETTTMLPSSPYGIAKLAAYHMARTYRDSYGMFISNGILFNHESPRRGSNFVTTKVINGALNIYAGLSNHIVLGNLDSSRDWGHSKDYVEAMYQILKFETPLDLVVSTGNSYSIRELCTYVFQRLGLDWQKYIKFDSKYLRPKEVPNLRGDSSLARKTLGWRPKYDFYTLIDEMIEDLAEKMKIPIKIN